MKKSSLIALAALLLATSASAQAPYLVADLNTTTAPRTSSSAPSGFATVNGKIVFTAWTPDNGREPWAVSGGVATLLADVNAGSGDGVSRGGYVETANGLVFIGWDATHGYELWRTDGTVAGTGLLKDINPTGHGAVLMAGRVGTKVIFTATDGVNGAEPWVTDGTAAGTRMLINLDGTSASTASAMSVISAGDRAFLFALNQLWVTDGTPEGTRSVGVQVIWPRGGAVVGSTVYFTADTAGVGRELWKSDGTAAGTSMVADIVPGVKGAFDTNTRLAALNGSVYFVSIRPGFAGFDLGVSDGTAAGTRVVKELVPQDAASTLTTAGSLLYMGTNELWRSDGTAAGTYGLVTGETRPTVFAVTHAFGRAFFLKRVGTTWSEVELWSTDGTQAGTARVIALAGETTALTAVAGKLYFSTPTALHGAEPWVSDDGTAAGTHLLVNVSADPPASSEPMSLTAAGNLVYFTANDGVTKTREVYRSDGTARGTFPVTEFWKTMSFWSDSLLTGWRGALYFRNSNLWRSDGTVAGTAELKNVSPEELFASTSYLYMDAGAKGVWRSDGTAAGTIDLAPSTYDYDRLDRADGFAELAGRVYTIANSTQTGIFVVGGTPAETKRIADLGQNDANTTLVSGAGALFFGRSTSERGSELWRSDGTAGGMKLVKDIAPGAASSTPSEITAAGRYVYFVADDGVHGQELWRTDGTAAGTILLRDIAPNAASSSPAALTAAGGFLYFTATDATNGMELWRSDGSEAGTQLVADLRSGAASSAPASLTGVDGTLYFTADDGVYGPELWETSGPAVPTLVADLEPGSNGSVPSGMTRAGDLLFFTASTGSLGRELWALPLTGSTNTLTIGDVRVTEGHSGTRTAALTVTRGGETSGAASANWATSDGSASAGSDYVAQSGTVSFGAGETAKTIAISITGDEVTETDEAVLVTLSAPAGAVIARPTGTVLIEDDDRRIDLNIEWVPLGPWDGERSRRFRITNAGPSTATNIEFKYSESPHEQKFWVVTIPTNLARPKSDNPFAERLPVLAPGESTEVKLDVGYSYAYTDPVMPPGRTITASVTAAEAETSLTNNSVSQMLSADGYLTLPPFLTTGTTATANVVVPDTSASRTLTLQSSLSSVTVTPASISLPPGQTFGAFTLTSGGQTGMALLTSSGSFSSRLTIPVVSPGTSPKLDVGIIVQSTTVAYGATLEIPVRVAGVRHDGRRPTGSISMLDAAGNVLATQTLDATAATTFQRQGLAPGEHELRFRYHGDAEFNALSGARMTATVTGRPVEMEIQVPRVLCAGEVDIVVYVRSQPEFTPTGTVYFSNVNPPERVTLTPTGTPGEARASVRRNLTAPVTVAATYEPTGGFATSGRASYLGVARCLSMNFSATGSGSQVLLQWSAVSGASGYYAACHFGGGMWTSSALSTTSHSVVLTPGRVYLCTVTAHAADGSELGKAFPDVATTIAFTDEPLVPRVTTFRRAHYEEVQNAAYWLRNIARSAAPFVPIAVGAPVRATDIVALRNEINAGRAALGLAPFPFTGAITQGTPIRAQHMQELRDAVK